jgi:hypothetical protein
VMTYHTARRSAELDVASHVEASAAFAGRRPRPVEAVADLAGVDQVVALVMPGLRTSDRSTKRSIDAHPTALQDLTEAVRERCKTSNGSLPKIRRRRVRGSQIRAGVPRQVTSNLTTSQSR